MKNKFLTVVIALLLMFCAAKNACATLIEWTLDFDSTLGVPGNVADFEYVFAIDTAAEATKTFEGSTPNTITNPWPASSYFYAEYVSKNGDEKGFDYLTYPAEDSYPYDWNLGVYYPSSGQLHLEMFENPSNALYLNIFFDSSDFESDLSQATSLSIRDVDGGVNYAASNVLADHFTLSRTAAVPEPATMLLFGTGLIGFAVRRRRKV